MERRLFYSAPDLEIAAQCHALAKELEVADGNFSVISIQTDEIRQRHLPVANYLKSLDIPRSSFRGLAYGFAGGVILLTLFELIKPLGLNISVNYYWAPVLFTSCFGLWLGIMIGLAQVNHHLRPFMNKVKGGGSIVIIDVTEAREAEIERIFRQRIPSAKLEKATDLSERLFDQTG